MYEEDVHDFLTRYLAEAAGFDKKTAEEIGIATFALDLDGRSAIVGGRAQHDNMDRFHFVSWQQLGVLGDIAFQGKRYGRPRVQLDQDKVARIGEYIHALQDTYAHQKGETYRRFGDYYTGGFLNIGHGLRGHRPDWTWERPELAMQMARDVYGELVALCQRYSSFCHPRPFPQLMSQIDLFIRFEPALYREYVHLGAGHHAVVDDVVDYTAKIQLLDASYQPTPEERAARSSRVAMSRRIARRQEALPDR